MDSLILLNASLTLFLEMYGEGKEQ